MPRLRLLLAFALSVQPLMAQSGDAAATRRLAALGRVWGFARYHHPLIGTDSTIDWDAAVVAAIPMVRAARTRAEYATAVRGMAAALRDPLTGVLDDSAAADGPAPPPFGIRRTGDGILVISVGDYYGLTGPAPQQALRAVLAELTSVRAVVIDVRAAEPLGDFARFQLDAALEPIGRRLTTTAVPLPGALRRVAYGFEAGLTFSSGQYRSGTLVAGGGRLLPAAGAVDRPVTFVTNRYGWVPSWGIARRAKGSARIVFEGDPADADIGTSTALDLGEGLRLRVRTAEPVFDDGTSVRFGADLAVRGTGAVDSAIARAVDPGRVGALPATRLGVGMPRDRGEAAGVPDASRRLLGLFRFWNAVEWFYPYKALIGRPWEEVLPAYVERFLSADAAPSYARAVIALGRELHDSHTYFAGAVIDSVIGPGWAPVRIRRIEGKLLVTALTDSSAARAGARVGDELLRVDGVPAESLFARTREVTAASTPWSLEDRAAMQFLNGAIGGAFTATVRDASGGVRDVRLVRKREDYTTLYHREREGPVVRRLPGNIGYVDLDRLQFQEVDAMFDTLRTTRAIIFDMRGYPNGTVWPIASRLTDREPVAARFRTPALGTGAPITPAWEAFEQRVGAMPAGAWRYTGRIVMLIDERSQSQAEHTGLFLRAAGGARFVGGPTSGANGEITSISLPGGITVGFTGQEVVWPDGTRLQRRGLQPDVVARPTIAGIRAGRDEVLDRAVRWIVSGR